MIRKSKLIKKFKDDSLHLINMSIPQAFEIFDSANYTKAKPILNPLYLLPLVFIK